MVSKLTKRITLIATFMAFLLAFGIVVGEVRKRDDVLQSIDLFGEILYYVKTRYVEPVDNEKLFNGALHGLAENLDPESFYLEEGEYQEYLAAGKTLPEDMLGLQFIKLNQYLRVISVEPGSIAEKTKIKSGDFITHINGIAAYELSLFKVKKMLSGKAGTEATFDLLKSSTGLETKISIKRENVTFSAAVNDSFSKKIRYLALNHFYPEDVETLKSIIADSSEKLLLVDLRNNYLGSTEGLALAVGLFSKEKDTAFIELVHKDKKIPYKAKGKKIDHDKTMYILTNQTTTHFAELFATIMKESGSAKIIGRNTTGLTGLQSAIPLENQGALFLTTTIFLTASEKNHYMKGIKPDLEIKIPKDSIDKKYPVKSDAGLIDREDPLLLKTIKEMLK